MPNDINEIIYFKLRATPDRFIQGRTFTAVLRSTHHLFPLRPMRTLLSLAIFLGATTPSLAGLELRPSERMYLFDLRAQGVSSVSMIIAARVGTLDRVTERVRAEGGTVLETYHTIDGLYANVPISRVEAIMNLPGVELAQLTGSNSYLFLSASEAEHWQGVPDLRSPDFDVDNPFSGQRLTQALQFKKDNPTFDGRGVTIGAMEAMHPRLPSLSWALNLLGQRMPKLVDYALHPLPPGFIANSVPSAGEPPNIIWRRGQEVTRMGNNFVVFADQAYRLPIDAKGQELLMVRNENKRAAVSVTALWDVSEEKVWLLGGNEVDFGKSKAIVVSPGNTHIVSVPRKLPVDSSDSAQQWLVLGVHGAERAIGLQLYFSDHGDMTATIAAGHNFFGGRSEGAAPGARLLNHIYELHAWGLTKGALDLPALNATLTSILDDRNDLFTYSWQSTEGRYDRGSSAIRLLYERALAKSAVIAFAASGNTGPVLGTQDYFVGVDSVITVGGYAPNETKRTLYGVEPTQAENLASYSAWGPREDGGLKPELVALTEILAEASEGSQSIARADRSAGIYLGGGTSAATPSAAGHVALLVSAAKQSSIPYDRERVRAALFSTCRFLPGIEARAQGHGLIQVADAWRALQRLKDYDLPQFQTEAPVHTYRSSWLTLPNVGVGLFESIGWSPHQKGQREITIARLTGPNKPITYKLRWKGHTGVFRSSMTELTLGRGKPVRVPVTIEAGESGSYSAILDLIDSGKDVIVHSVLCTILVAEPLTSENGFQAVFRRSLVRPGHTLVYVNVAAATSALAIQVEQQGGVFSFGAQMPSGRIANQGVNGSGIPVSSAGGISEEKFEQTFLNPEPGVWQIWLTDRATPRAGARIPLENSPRWLQPLDVKIKVSAYGVATQAEPFEAGGKLRLTFSNRFKPVESARIRSLGLGSGYYATAVLKPGLEPLFYNVEIPPGTTKLEAEIAAEQGFEYLEVTLAILHISPTHDTSPTGAYSTIMEMNLQPGANKRVELADPMPGSYRIVVDPVRIPATGLRIAYRDSFFHAAFGRLNINDQTAKLETGSLRVVEATLDVVAYPVADRQLVAQLGLFSDEVNNMRSKLPEGTRPTAELIISKTSPAIASPVFQVAK